MSSYRRYFILAIVAALPLRLLADSGELLLPVSDSVAENATVNNEYFLGVVLYAAKQHRIVSVNETVLTKGGQVSIALFDDEKMIFDKKELKYQQENTMLHWTGTLANPPIGVDEISSQMHTDVDDAMRVHSAFFDIVISASPYEYDSNSGANFPFVDVAGYAEAKEKEKERFFYGVSFSIRTANRTRLFKLKPLDMGGALHVLYEVDETKVLPLAPEAGEETAENRQKRLAAEEYFHALGENPKISILREKARDAAMRKEQK